MKVKINTSAQYFSQWGKKYPNRNDIKEVAPLASQRKMMMITIIIIETIIITTIITIIIKL